MTARLVRWWSIVHRWSSLIATAFLLLLCLTGLPLIFHHEIDEALGYAPRVETSAAGQRVRTDDIAQTALRDHPGMVLQYIAWERDHPGIVTAYVNHAVNGKPDDAVLAAYSGYSGKALGVVGVGPMLFVLKLHTDMFAGLAGKLFLGGMGMLFLAAIVSGVVLYWPFTRRLEFGTVRYDGSQRVTWLDWHNLLAIATVVWAIVVSATGVVNTWAELMLDRWRATELSEMIAPYAGRPLPVHLASIDLVLANAARVAPGTDPAFVAFPRHAVHQFAPFRGVLARCYATDVAGAPADPAGWRNGGSRRYAAAAILSQTAVSLPAVAFRRLCRPPTQDHLGLA